MNLIRTRGLGNFRRWTGVLTILCGIAALTVAVTEEVVRATPTTQTVYTNSYSRGNDDPNQANYETATIDVSMVVEKNCQEVPVTNVPGDGSGGDETPPGGQETPPDGDAPPPGGTTEPPADGGTDTPPDGGGTTTEPPAEGGDSPPAEDPPADGENPDGEGETTNNTVCTGDVSFKLKYEATASTSDTQFLSVGGQYNLHGTNTSGNSVVSELAQGVEQDGNQITEMTLTGEIALGSVPCNGGTIEGTAEIKAPLSPPIVRDTPNGPETISEALQQTVTYKATVKRCGDVTIDELSLEQHTLPFPGLRSADDIQVIQIGSNYMDEPSDGWDDPYPDRDDLQDPNDPSQGGNPND